MENFMVDLETLGRRPGCIVLSVGGVMFDPESGQLGEEFYTVISQSSCANYDMHIDPDTAEWWRKQSPEAQLVLREAKSPDAPSLKLVCSAIGGFLKPHGTGIKVWGNGANFDNPILAECFRRTGVKQPWEFWDDRCYRTLKNLYPQVKMEKSGVQHNALADAKQQAAHALKIFEYMKNA